MKSINWTKEEENILIDNVDTKTIDELCLLFVNRNKKSITNKIAYFRKLGKIKPFSPNHNTIFFNAIDTPEKAYVLGWFMSDGSLNNKHEGIKFELKDLDAIELLKKLFESTGTITKRINKKYNSTSYKIHFSSKQIDTDLRRMGFDENKSFTCKFPADYIPEHLISHVIRGILDGDGCIKFRKKGKNNICLSILGTQNICEFIRSWNDNTDVKHISKRKNIYDYRLDSIKAVSFLHKIYKDSTDLCLLRKYNKYKNYCIERSIDYV